MKNTKNIFLDLIFMEMMRVIKPIIRDVQGEQEKARKSRKILMKKVKLYQIVISPGTIIYIYMMLVVVLAMLAKRVDLFQESIN